jgi:hypothetical protein
MKRKKLRREELEPANDTQVVLTNTEVIKEAKVIPRKSDDPSLHGGVQFENERR